MKYRPFEDLYKQVLIQEMNQEVIDYITSQRTEALPWDNLFGDKKRMIIPLEKETRFSALIEQLKALPNFHDFDAEKEQVIFKKPRDPKYGKGNFYFQPKSIGAAINELPISTDRKNYELNLFSTYKKEFLKELKNPSSDGEYSIVFSRAPNDIIRMSDWPALMSCLNKKGCNFHRVAHEAIKGGGVAYVVKNKYLDDFKDDPEFLNGDDTFTDNQRELEAVQEPESRIKIRRFVSENGMDFAIPENALFGNQRLPTFWQSMVNWLKPRQPSAEEVKNEFKTSDITLKGSSYGMESLEDMLSAYFGEPYTDFVDYDPEDYDNKMEHEKIKSLAVSDTPEFEDELQEIDNRYPLEHAYSHWDVDSDGEMDYYTYSGGISFDMDELQLSEDVDEDLSDEYDVRRRSRQPDNFGNFIQELSEKRFGNLMMTSYYFNSDRDTMYIGLTPEDSVSTDSDDYDTFKFNLKMADDQHEDIHEDIVQMLLRYDLIESMENRPGEYQRLKADMVEEMDWNNFRHEVSVKYLKIIKYSPESLITRSVVKSFRDMSPEEYKQYGTFEEEFNRFCISWRSSIGDSVKESILNLADHNFRPPTMKSDMEQMDLGMAYEQMLWEQVSYHNTQRLVDFEVKIYITNHNSAIDYSNFSLTTNSSKDVAYELADYLDDMWQHVEGMITLIAWECVKQTVDNSSNINNEDNQYFGYMPKNLVQLQRLYGKYVDTSMIGKI